MSRRVTTSRQHFVPVLAVALLAAISTVPAGRGHLGSPLTLTGSKVDVTIANRTFSHTIIPGESTIAVRDALVLAINDPNSPYSASNYTDPLDPNDVAFEVLNDGGTEVRDIQLCEDSASLPGLAVAMPRGLDVALIAAPTTVNADGTYTVQFKNLVTGVVTSFSYVTSVPPNNTAAGLIGSLTSDLTAAGYTVLEGRNSISIRRTNGTPISHIREASTDTGIKTTCTTLAPSSVPVAPTVSQYGFFALVLLMTAAALLMLRRKSLESGTGSTS